MQDCLYISQLNANLISARKVCRTAELKDIFNSQKIYFYRENKVILLIKSEESIYCLNYIKSDLLYILYQVTDLKQLINILSKVKICNICVIIKFKKRLYKQLAKYKDKKLALISVDTADLFLLLIQDFRYFTEVIKI